MSEDTLQVTKGQQNLQRKHKHLEGNRLGVMHWMHKGQQNLQRKHKHSEGNQ